ncbi:MAG TPA: hypothetical protein VFA39_15515 [Steroidobacteraceae bacterium]|nr:hypothetical protein [Steroidobacteraceae bacterium]
MRIYQVARPAFQWARPKGVLKYGSKEPRYLHVAKAIRLVPTDHGTILVQVQNKGATYKSGEPRFTKAARRQQRQARIERLHSDYVAYWAEARMLDIDPMPYSQWLHSEARRNA